MPTEIKFDRLPVSDGVITGKFGDDYGGYLHRGVDIAPPQIRRVLPNETPIVSPIAGTSVWFHNGLTTWKGNRVKSFGEGVCIDHGADYFPRYSLYAHMSKLLVDIGEAILPGQVIGHMGLTGVTTGYHTHWQLSNSVYFSVNIKDNFDPLEYKEPELTETEVRELINEMRDDGDLASTTDVLACIAQIVGVEDLTYADKARVGKVRKALNIGTTPVTK